MAHKKFLKMFLKKKETSKNNLFERINAKFLFRNEEGLFFSFINPDTNQEAKGFIDYKNVSNLTDDDFEAIFTPNSIHKVLLTSYKNKDMHILNYKSLHPEINNNINKILPTAQHFRTLLRHIKKFINERKEKKQND